MTLTTDQKEMVLSSNSTFEQNRKKSHTDRLCSQFATEDFESLFSGKYLTKEGQESNV